MNLHVKYRPLKVYRKLLWNTVYLAVFIMSEKISVMYYYCGFFFNVKS